MLRFVSRNLAPLTLVASVAAYAHPPAFMVFEGVFLWLFAATMLCLGLVLDPGDVRDALGRPLQIALGVLTQYLVMPVLGLGAALLVQRAGGSPALALGFIVVGSAPGAMASNVLVYLAGGAVAFSVAMTTAATFLAPLLTPWLVEGLGGRFLPVPFWPMMQTILMTVVVPLTAGMAVRPWLGRVRAGVERAAPAVASLAIVVICSYAMAANADRIAEVGMGTLAVVAILNGLGYLAGWGLGRLYRFDGRHRLTLAIEIGMQNAGLGVALALEHFAPETALPGALFAVWCILTAAGATGYLRRKGRLPVRAGAA
ncbi:bile acid:sodium symporter family protein [Thiohalorhabdus methylotrophus]|uniref:Bile acid:sodium symporter family protein n=1 Tax=Thiohalorhabdus methylotrophus TaxID=3242694 RepID=A0ABV4TYV1_9GAMM